MPRSTKVSSRAHDTAAPDAPKETPMKFIVVEPMDHRFASLVYVAVCVGCAGCVLYLVAALAAAAV
jgi:hypothetical protein